MHTDNKRAVQFAPFAALSGYGDRIEALKIKEEEKRILSEEAAAALSERLSWLRAGDCVMLKYYSQSEKRYKTAACELREVDFVFKRLKTGTKYISFEDIEAVKELKK